MSNEKQSSFQVYAVEYKGENEERYIHWSGGLVLYIIKDGVKMKLISDEIKQLVKALPKQ